MKKRLWLYGFATGILLLVLQAIHYQALIRDMRLELFGLLIAVIFLAMGIWIGISIYHKTQKRYQRASKNGNLSDRELDVLLLMADGFSNQEIADKLFVSLNTIKTHISNIYQKLGTQRRTQAIQKARELGIISSSEQVN